MNKLQKIGFGLSKTFGRTGLIIQKNLPTILMCTGIAAGVASTAFAVKATLHVDEVIDEAKQNIDKVKEARETHSKEVYSDFHYKQDLAGSYARGAVKVAKLYAPTVALGLVSIGCAVGGNKIMTKRNLAMAAAYKAVAKSFEAYRERVIDEFGEEKDLEFKGVHKTGVTITTVDEDGKEVTVEANVKTFAPGDYSMYARVFAKSQTSQWCDNPEYNLHFLKHQQNFMNDLLNARGHVFLNEVYDALGFNRTTEGAIVGWVRGHGDSHIDFGIHQIDSDEPSPLKCSDWDDKTVGEQRIDFINGNRDNVLLDFNVDGIIYDLI